MKERGEKKKGEDYIVSVEQSQNKFKTVSTCYKNAAMAIKTKSALNQFQDQTEYVKSFTRLAPLIQSRASA